MISAEDWMRLVEYADEANDLHRFTKYGGYVCGKYRVGDKVRIEGSKGVYEGIITACIQNFTNYKCEYDIAYVDDSGDIKEWNWVPEDAIEKINDSKRLKNNGMRKIIDERMDYAPVWGGSCISQKEFNYMQREYKKAEQREDTVGVERAWRKYDQNIADKITSTKQFDGNSQIRDYILLHNPRELEIMINGDGNGGNDITIQEAWDAINAGEYSLDVCDFFDSVYRDFMIPEAFEDVLGVSEEEYVEVANGIRKKKGVKDSARISDGFADYEGNDLDYERMFDRAYDAYDALLDKGAEVVGWRDVANEMGIQLNTLNGDDYELLKSAIEDALIQWDYDNTELNSMYPMYEGMQQYNLPRKGSGNYYSGPVKLSPLSRETVYVNGLPKTKDSCASVSDSKKIKDSGKARIYKSIWGDSWVVEENVGGRFMYNHFDSYNEAVEYAKKMGFDTQIEDKGLITDSKKIKDDDGGILDGKLMIAFKEGAADDMISKLKEHENESGEIDGAQYEIYGVESQDGVAAVDMTSTTSEPNDFVKTLLKNWGIESVDGAEFKASEEMKELQQNQEVSDSKKVEDDDDAFDEYFDYSKESVEQGKKVNDKCGGKRKVKDAADPEKIRGWVQHAMWEIERDGLELTEDVIKDYVGYDEYNAETQEWFDSIIEDELENIDEPAAKDYWAEAEDRYLMGRRADSRKIKDNADEPNEDWEDEDPGYEYEESDGDEFDKGDAGHYVPTEEDKAEDK